MSTSLIIRPAELDDFTQWKMLWSGYNEFYGRVGSTALPDEIVMSTWKRFLDPSEPMQCLIAEENGQMVGLAHFIFHHNTITIESTCYLQDLFTDPRMRGKGIARALISAFADKAKAEGTKSVYWHTHMTNKTAMKLYDKVAVNTEFVVYRKPL